MTVESTHAIALDLALIGFLIGSEKIASNNSTSKEQARY